MYMNVPCVRVCPWHVDRRIPKFLLATFFSRLPLPFSFPADSVGLNDPWQRKRKGEAAGKDALSVEKEDIHLE
jgi:hypothetical protein